METSEYSKVIKVGLMAGLLFGAGYLTAKFTPSQSAKEVSAEDDLAARQAEYERVQQKIKLSYHDDLAKEPRSTAFKTEPSAQPEPIAAPEPPAPKAEEPKPSSDKLAGALSKALGRETPDSVSNTAKAELPAVTGSAFAVQVASLPDRKVAEELANRLTLKGYEARLVQADIPGRGLVFRVRIHGYDSRGEADAARVEINQREHLDAITVAQ